MLLSNKKERIADTRCGLDGSRSHRAERKSRRENGLYESILENVSRSPAAQTGTDCSPVRVWGRFCLLPRPSCCSLGSWVCVGTSAGLSALGWALCFLMPGFGSSRGQVLDGTSRQAASQLGIPQCLELLLSRFLAPATSFLL